MRLNILAFQFNTLTPPFANTMLSAGLYFKYLFAITIKSKFAE